jgi:hypothetical protein
MEKGRWKKIRFWIEGVLAENLSRQDAKGQTDLGF